MWLGRRLFEKVVSWGAIVAASAAMVLVLAVSVDVFNRRLFGGSVPGLLELNQTILVVIVFLAIPYGEKTGAHVRMTLLTSRLPERFARICRTLSYTLAVGLSGWMAYASLTRATDSFERDEAHLGLVMWPLWPARWVLAIGLCLLAIQCCFKISDAIAGRPLEVVEGIDDPSVLERR
jgi:TRAP-type C4-dicarboxylate transport system permease small subunit